MYDGGGSEGSADGQTIWDQLNEKWYSFCDAVEDKGAKIYEYFVNPLEERNIPSLPVAVILLLLLLLSLGWLLFGSSLGGGAGQAYSLSVSVTGERGAVNDALVTLSQDDSDLSSLKTEDGVALFDDLAQGEYEIAVSKDGFENGSKRVSIPDEKYVEISLRPLSGAGPIRPPGFGAGNGSGGNGGQLNFSRWPDDWNSTRGVILNLFVSDTLNSTVPSAIATIYDRESGTRLQTVDVENGWAAVEDLDVGMVVYADVAADGYAPYDGHSNAVTITVEGPNLLNVVLTPLNGPGGANASGEWQTTVLSVVDQNNTPVQAAQVQVFKIGSTTPVAIPDSFTNSSGRLAIVLNASGNPFYQILVSKLGYVSNSSGFFHAGAAVNVLLYSLGGGDGGNGTCTGSNCQSCVGSDCSCSNGQCICTGPNCSICTGADCSCSTGTCTCTGPDCNTCTGPDCIVPPHCPGSADCPPIFENLSTLIIFVSSDSQPVPDASIVVWRPQDNIRLDGDTGSNGAAQFLFIPRNASVVVNASKNNFFATGSIVMNAPVVQLNLSLSRARGTVIARALNFANGQPIATAQFSAFPEGTSVLESSCAVQEPFDSCSLRAGLGLHYDIGVMAPGFIGESQSIVMDGQVVEVTFYLVRESDVGISQIKDFKVSLQGSNDPAGVLYPGRTYEATFTLLGNTSSASDSFGFYFDVESSRAVIKSVTPPGPAAKSLGSQSQSCTPQQVNYANASAAWVDFSYAGGTHPTGKAVKIVFEIKPLPQGVDEDNFTVHYRSYLVQGGMYYRNPFSRELGFNAASPLASGCGAPSFDRQYAINGLGTTCSDFACIRVMFNQIGATGVRDNFTARFVSGAQQDLVSYGPMLMSYEIMLKPNVATLPDSGELMLSFNAPGNYLGVSTVSYPDQPDSQGTPPNPADTTVSMFGSEGLLNSVSISLDHLRRYSNMDAGFTFGGEFALIPLNPVQGGQLTLDVSAGNQSSTHTSTYNVEQSSVRADDFTVVAFNDVKQYPNVHNADPFAASSTANCTAENTLPTFGRNGFANQCHHGYVEASFSILVRSNLSNARLVFNTPSDLPSSLIYQPPSLKKDGVPVPLVQPAFSQTGFSVDLGFIRAGSRVEGTEFLIPSTDGNYNLSVGVSYSGLDNGVVKQVVVGSANGSSPGCFPPNSPECLGTPVPDGNISLIGSIPRDSCGSYVVVKFDPVQRQKVLLQTQSQDKDCGSIQMRATPLFPADALPVSVSTSNPILVTADQDDGSSPCFESCRVNAQGQVEESSCSRGFNAFTQNGNNVLRYNPESYSQCQQFQSVGNHLKPAKIRIKLSPSTLTSVPAYLNITVSTLDAFDSPSLFIGPIYTPVLSFAKPDPTYPQLWAVTNLNQLGHRTIDVYLASPSSPDQPIQRYPPFQFDGPGTQVFGVSRNPSNLVVVAKEKGVTVLVENAVGTYNVSGLSEYADFVTTAIQAVGSPTGNQANVLARSNVGFMPDVVKPILEKIKLRAEQSAFWRTSGSAVCQESAACVENGYQPFSDCCRAKAEDWAKTTITYTSGTETCTFCNNLGNPADSTNYDETTQSCILPINPDASYPPFCTPESQFNSATQVYCDSRCSLRDLSTDEGSENLKMVLVVGYNESYRASATAPSTVCSADFAVARTQITDVEYQDCITGKGAFCPIVTLTDSLDGQRKPVCVPPSSTVNGLLSSDETDENSPDVPDSYTPVLARFNDGNAGNPNDDLWYCESGNIFAVSDFCSQQDCNTYCSNGGAAGIPNRCDFIPACGPDGRKLVETADVSTQDLNSSPLVEVPFARFAPAEAVGWPMALFPSSFSRGFQYHLTVNTQVVPTANSSDGQQVFDVVSGNGGQYVQAAFQNILGSGYPLGAPSACNQGNFAYQGIFDLQSSVSPQQSGLLWNSMLLNEFNLNPVLYQNIACGSPINQGAIPSCHLLYPVQMTTSANTACISSIAKFTGGSAPLSSLKFAGRLGGFKGTKKFAITPTGYVVSLVTGGKYKQVFDWWKPDGSYGGTFTLKWKKTNWLKMLLTIAIVGAILWFSAGTLAAFIAPVLHAAVGAVIIGIHWAVVIGGGLAMANTLYGAATSSTKGCKKWKGWGDDARATVYGCRKDYWQVKGLTPPT